MELRKRWWWQYSLLRCRRHTRFNKRLFSVGTIWMLEIQECVNHSFELGNNSRPDLKRTRMCRSIAERRDCSYRNYFFAHSADELVVRDIPSETTTPIKYRICPLFSTTLSVTMEQTVISHTLQKNCIWRNAKVVNDAPGLRRVGIDITLHTGLSTAALCILISLNLIFSTVNWKVKTANVWIVHQEMAVFELSPCVCCVCMWKHVCYVYMNVMMSAVCVGHNILVSLVALWI